MDKKDMMLNGIIDKIKKMQIVASEVQNSCYQLQIQDDANFEPQ